jgi:serine phosphatase RsbU (regulator of sigma subunit)
VEEVVQECWEGSAQSIVNSLFKAATEHAAGEETFDDQTVVAIKLKGESKARK